MKSKVVIGLMVLSSALIFLLVTQINPPVPSVPASAPPPAVPVTTPTPSAPAAVSVPPAPPTLPVTPAASAPAAVPVVAASLTISRMVIARSVEDRQPSGITASFPASQEGVYCYLELTNVTRDQGITYAWTFGRETDRATQHIKKSEHWRTWSYKAISGQKGNWKVDVLDESGTTLKSATFKVE
jgi:hypothetical protein